MTISTREWSLKWLLEKSGSFKPARRVPCTIKNLGDVIEQYEESDVPLVIEGWHQTSHWPTEIFNMEFCRQYFRRENKKISVRNVHSRSDMSMIFEDFLESSRTASTFVEPEETQRLYGKDVECPHDWEEWLLSEGVIPTQLLPGGRNDLLALRPPMNGRPDIETLMCYFGIGDTYTPCHKDLCASSGQNLMCYTEPGSSSFWFMTKGSDCSKVANYFHNNVKDELDHEAHVMSLSDLAKAPFDIYITEQKLGDLVLVPPRSCHQVVNSGKISIKMSWSRMTLFGLAVAFYHELPLYRRVCRAETYQIKSTIYYVLTDYTRMLKTFISKPFNPTHKESLKERLIQVLRLYDHVLIEEYFSHDNFIEAGKSRSEEGEEELPEQSSRLADHFQMCDFCGADIFHSYFRCSKSSGPESRTIICSGCYVEGRTCTCENMVPKQRQKLSILLYARWEALEVLKSTGYSIETFEGSESQKEQRSFFAKVHERSVFQAAMLVHQMRFKNTRQTRMCRLTDSHQVPSNWAISCKKCHSSKCFFHLLNLYHMHCILALFSIKQDASHMVYHSKHAANFPDYKAKEKSFLKDQEEKPSSAPDFAVQLVHNVLKFPVCQPLKSAHTKPGWYDKALKAPKEKPKERKPQPQLIDSTGPDSDGEVDGSDTPSDPRSPGNSSQKSTKNNAYVDIKSRTSAAPSRILSREISISSLTSDSEVSDSDDMPLRRYFEKRPKRNLPDEPQAMVDLEPDTRASSANTGGKRRQEFKSLEPSGDSTIFAVVDRIGPPRKKRRQEPEPQNRETQSKEPPSKPTKDASKMRKDKLDDFAASLGAAINQVAENANQTMKERRHRKGDVEQVKKKWSSGDSASMQPSATKTMEEKSSFLSSRKKPALVDGADLQATAPLPSEGPILVNIADLQDMITNAAEQVARKIVEGNSSTISLPTKTAVTMMTGYAATGKFVQGNTHIEFPSISHFKEAIVKGADNTTAKASSSIDQRQPKTLTAKSGVHASDNHHQQTRETAIDAQSSSSSSSSTFAPQRKRPSAPDLSSRTLHATQKKRRTHEDEI